MKILVLAGDGIGPEITAAAETVLAALIERFELGLDLETRDIGLAAHAACGSTLPDDVMEEIRAAAGVVLGPCDTYAYPPTDQGGFNPSSAIRKGLDLYANIRPARARKGVPATAPDIDLVVVRENTEGFYADRNMFSGVGEFMPTEDIALAVRKITRAGSERIARSAFELARTRRNKVTAVHKANVLKVSDGLFLECVRRVGAEYPDVELEEVLIDAMTAHLIRTPSAYDVVVTTNMYGDILSDEAAELAGGLGLAGAINASTDHAIAQATHGSAPDIAGKDMANPTALLLSVQMLLVWLAGRHGDNALTEAATCLETAVDEVLADPANHTPDMGGSAGTEAFGAAVAAAIRD